MANTGFDPTDYYPLCTAFYLVGLTMFPDAWDGNEQFSNEPNSEVLDRGDLRLKVKSQEERKRELLFIDDSELTPDEVSQIDKQRHGLTREIEEGRRKFRDMDRAYDAPNENHQRWQRRLAVENKLCEAFRNGDLDVFLSNQSIVQWKSWDNQLQFQVSFQLSLIVLSQEVSSRRRNAAFVGRGPFNNWISKTFEINSRSAPEAEYFNALVKGSTTPLKKGAAIHALQREFPNMSKRKAIRVWDNNAPVSWKQPGPKS